MDPVYPVRSPFQPLLWISFDIFWGFSPFFSHSGHLTPIVRSLIIKKLFIGLEVLVCLYDIEGKRGMLDAEF